MTTTPEPLSDLYCAVEVADSDDDDARITIGKLREILATIDHRVAQATKAERERCPFVGFDDENLIIQWRDKGILIGIHADGSAWLSLKREGRGYAAGETPISATTLHGIAQAIRSTP